MLNKPIEMAEQQLVEIAKSEKENMKRIVLAPLSRNGRVEASLVCLVALYLLSGVSATGSPLAYTCKVVAVYGLDAEGGLKESPIYSKLKGSSFSVSRVSGEIIGEVLPTLMAKSTSVVHRGNGEYSFKTVAIFEGNVQVLEVQEFKSGIEKPFASSSMGGAGIVTGICR